jgi:predicted aconitase with swiveling domain
LPGITLNEGVAEAPTFLLQEPLSFWGGLDAGSGTIIDRWHPQAGDNLAGRILVMRSGRGSSSGSSVLAEAIRLGHGPAGIVLLARDPIITVGALVAAALYHRQCPVVVARQEDWPAICSAGRIALAATEKAATITIR